MLPVLSQGEADLTACYVQDISALLESFSEKETSGKQSLQQMLSSDPSAFSRAAIRVLASVPGAAGARYVVHLLRKHNLLMDALADLTAKSEDAVGAARVIPQVAAPIDADLEKVLSASLSQVAGNAAKILRLLEMLEAASAQPRFYLFQAELLAHQDSGVRSRSVLLIARSSKNTAFVGRMLLDEDVRVQANAVEALWTFDPEEARPLLLNAARSKTPRVAGNAAVGLHRIGDLSVFRLLFNMAGHEDGARRASAAWAMGETGDPRFLPFLTAWFPRSIGAERVNILQALGRIRRREKALADAGGLQIRVWDSQANGFRRRVVFTVHPSGRTPLGMLKATDFALWNGSALVDDYQIVVQPNPALAISGFVLPRLSSMSDPYSVAIREAIDRCLPYKRADDLWRIDRYLIEPRAAESGPPLEKAALPYEESLLGPLAKAHQRGFLAAPEALRKIAEAPGGKERAADDAIAAFDRQSDAMIKFSGRRRLFLFVHGDRAGRADRHMARLASFVANERITLHGFCVSADNEDFQKLCLASDGGTFATCTPTQIPDAVERIYAQSLDRFEVNYRVPDESGCAEGSVQITGASGCGRADFSF